MSEPLTEGQKREERFKSALKPRLAYMIDYGTGEPELEEVTLLEFNIDHAAGATGYACTVKGKNPRKFRCSCSMVYLTPEEAKQKIVDDYRENLQALLDEQVNTANRITAAFRTLRRYEEDLKI